MQNINSSTEPAIEAGVFINKLFKKHQHKNIIFFMSGGSAINVLNKLDVSSLGKHVTAIMADDQFTNKEIGSNYLQMKNSKFYPEAKAAGVKFIDTTAQKHKDQSELADGLNKKLQTLLTNKKDTYCFGLFGVGHDCHTANIFPAQSKEKFDQIYKHEGPYIGVLNKQGSDYPERVTLTPSFIQKQVKELVVYAAGKQEVLLSIQFAKHEWQCPGLILTNHKKSFLFTDAEIMNL